MARYDEEDAMSNMSSSMNSSSESNLRANANSRESYSEQRLRKNAKPMVKAKPKAKPVVGRAGAQTPGQRAKLAPRGTPMRPTKPVGDRGMDARLAAKKAANKGTPMRPTKAVGDRAMDSRLAAKKKNVGSRFADALTGANKPKLSTAAKAAEQAKLKKAYDIAKAKKKGM
jgi:hypothetical protein